MVIFPYAARVMITATRTSRMVIRANPFSVVRGISIRGTMAIITVALR